jgi:hypothetical protein
MINSVELAEVMAQISKSLSRPANWNKESSIVSHIHGNMRDDGWIQSLSSPYGAPAYRERAEKLIEEIKHLLFRYMEDRCNDDLIKRAQIVDMVQCLGIDRHFQHELRGALDCLYRCWNERGIGVGSGDSLIKDLNATALGFRVLRLHQYNVSSGVLENFKDENGQFFCNSTGEQEEENKRVRSMLSLLRASSISFPGEKVMDEAKAFATDYLNRFLTGRSVTDVEQSLLREVKYALEFPWHCSVPRSEARSFIEIYGQNDSWLKSIMNKKILELAKLDFNILQSTHQKDLQLISRWLTDSDIAQLDFYRKRHVELFFWVATGAFEPEFSSSRIAFTKVGTMITFLDDIYDTHGNLDELKIFTEAVKRWDLSLIDCLPEYMKIALKFFLKTHDELVDEVMRTQGRDMASYIRKNAWERFIEASMQDAEWRVSGHVPTFDEYIKHAQTTTGLCAVNLITLLLMGPLLPDNILEQIYSPSKFQHLIELTTRLTDDARDFEAEKEHGELASSVECYLKDNPEFTVEDALNHTTGIVYRSLKELNWEFIKHDSVPLCCKKFVFNFARSMQLFFKDTDGFSNSTKEIKDQIFKVLIDQVPV